MAASYATWRAELKVPTAEDRRGDRSTTATEMSGFWRVVSARTKPDWPVAIWTEEGHEETVFQIGRKIMRTDTHQTEWQEFIAGTWLKCIAVDQKAWGDALDTSRWPDGKPSREITDAEKADIIPTTPASEGGNAPDGGDDIREQVKERLETATHNIKAIGVIDSLHKANLVAGILETARAVWKQGEDERRRRKKPHDDAAAAVQALWVPILEPASIILKRANDEAVGFARKEEARIKAEQAAERAAEIAEQRKREAAEQAKQAESMGMENIAPSDEEIEAEALAEAQSQVSDTKVRVGTAHGKGLTKPTQKKGRITDMAAFFDAIKGFDQTVEFMQTTANRLARAGAKVPGLEIYSE